MTSPDEETVPHVPIAAGDAVFRSGAGLRARAAGWFYSTRWDEPVLLTVSHVLAAPLGNGPRSPSVVELDNPLFLCREGDLNPAAVVLAAGINQSGLGRRSVDAMIALALYPENISGEIYSPGGVTRIAQPRPGQQVTMQRDGEKLTGTVELIDWRSGHYGATDDLLVRDLQVVPGDSGALLSDAVTGDLVGMVVGRVGRGRSNGEPVFACAHPMWYVLRYFEGFSWLTVSRE